MSRANEEGVLAYEEPPGDVERPFMEHLVELSIRLRRIFIAVIVMGAILSFIPVDTETYIPLISYFPNYIIREVIPAEVTWKGKVYEVQIVQYNPFAGFNLLIKSALLLGLLGASPVIAREIYAYIEPALFPHEKRRLRRLSLLFIALFMLGVFVAFKVVMPVAFKFTILTSIAIIGGDRLVAFTDVEQLFTAIILISLATGLAFEAPLIVYLLVSFGIISPDWFKGENVRYVIFASMILGAVISPDPSGIGMLVIGGIFALSIIVAARLGEKASKRKYESGGDGQRIEETPAPPRVEAPPQRTA